MNNVSDICSRYLKICENRKSLSRYTRKAYRLYLKQFANSVGGYVDISVVNKEKIVHFHNGSAELELLQLLSNENLPV